MGGDGAGTGFSAHPDKLGDAGDQLVARWLDAVAGVLALRVTNRETNS
ncbi:hypothetical protein ABZW30_19475 [Kitasatospora sp. NPDC004669]